MLSYQKTKCYIKAGLLRGGGEGLQVGVVVWAPPFFQFKV